MSDTKGFKVGILNLLIFVIISSPVLPAESAEQIRLPALEKKTLLNGFEFMFLENTGGKVPFLLMIKNGAAFDPVEKWGVTQLMARMMIAGLDEELTKQSMKAAEIEINVDVDWDAIYFVGTSPPEALVQALSLLADIVVRPVFDEYLFTETRNTLLEEIRLRSDKLEIKTQELFRAKVLEGSPYAHPVQGTVSTLSNVQLRDVKIQFRRLLKPNQAKLALYFSGDREELFKRLSRRWGSWVKGEAAPFTFRGASVRKESIVVLVDQPPEQNGIVRWGAVTVSKDSRDYHALKVLEQYLTLSLPEWAQEISSSNQIRGSATLMAKRMPGYLQVSLRSPGEELVTYCRKLEQTMGFIKQGQIDLERFEEAKSLALREFKDSLRKPFHQLYQLLGTQLCDLGLNYIPTYGLRLKRVTPTVLQGVAETYFGDGRSVAVVAGSASQLGPDLAEIGTVEVLN